MPIVTKIVGFFPGRLLGMGEDLPRGFAMDWSRRRQPAIMVTDEDRRRFGAILAQYDQVEAPTLSLSVTDDAFAPPVAAHRLLASYPRMHAVEASFSPSDLGCRRLGHFAFLRHKYGNVFWERAEAWLLQAERNGRTSSQEVTSMRPLAERTTTRLPALPPHK